MVAVSYKRCDRIKQGLMFENENGMANDMVVHLALEPSAGVYLACAPVR